MFFCCFILFLFVFPPGWFKHAFCLIVQLALKLTRIEYANHCSFCQPVQLLQALIHSLYVLSRDSLILVHVELFIVVAGFGIAVLSLCQPFAGGDLIA